MKTSMMRSFVIFLSKAIPLKKYFFLESTKMSVKKLKSKPGGQSRFNESADLMLKSLVEQHGLHSWSLISKNFKNKSGKQCKERWYKYLSPSVNRNPWSPEEDRLIEELNAQLGNSWKKISLFLNGRLPGDVRFRYLKLQRRKKKKYLTLRKTNKKAKISIAQESSEQIEDKKPEKSTDGTLWNIQNEISERDLNLFEPELSSSAEILRTIFSEKVS